MSGTMVHHERSHTSDYPSPTHDSLQWQRRSWDGSSNKVIVEFMRDENDVKCKVFFTLCSHTSNLWSVDHPRCLKSIYCCLLEVTENRIFILI